jgi:large subunit ribosomal protein L22
MQQPTAKLNYLRIAPRKVRSVADLIRGMSVNDAEAQLSMVRRRPAKPLLKLLRSAVANAKNKQINVDHLFISEIRVDQGPMLKRVMPRARGSASPIQKKMSHITLVLGLNSKLAPKFTIPVAQKKQKTPKKPKADKEKPAREKRGPEVGPEITEPKKKQGFFRRTFSGKSRAAK